MLLKLIIIYRKANYSKLGLDINTLKAHILKIVFKLVKLILAICLNKMKNILLIKCPCILWEPVFSIFIISNNKKKHKLEYKNSHAQRFNFFLRLVARVVIRIGRRNFYSPKIIEIENWKMINFETFIVIKKIETAI